MAARYVVLLMALAAMLLAALGQKVFDTYERLAPVERACIGGVGNRTNLYDVVRRDCCSIPRRRLAGQPSGIDPCQLVQGDIINGVPGLSEFRNLFVLEVIIATEGPEAANTTPEVVEAFNEAQGTTESTWTDTFRVSTTRIWRTRQGDVCFCPIGDFLKDDSQDEPEKPYRYDG